MSEIRIVRATGDPYRSGVIIGKALADGHARSVDFMRRYTRRHGLADADLEPLLAPYLAAARTAVPRLVAHLEGIAEGSRLPFIDVFAVNAFEELYARARALGAAAGRGHDRAGASADAGRAVHRRRRASGQARRSSRTTSSGTPGTTAGSR